MFLFLLSDAIAAVFNFNSDNANRKRCIFSWGAAQCCIFLWAAQWWGLPGGLAGHDLNEFVTTKFSHCKVLKDFRITGKSSSPRIFDEKNWILRNAEKKSWTIFQVTVNVFAFSLNKKVKKLGFSTQKSIIFLFSNFSTIFFEHFFPPKLCRCVHLPYKKKSL